eukprot:CAMPEP_0113880324 /NCGR_PEP_ID=MMETSP0780_2-20120614/7721_1 /TAXON_ID=652834 /ORGANISM="Palpitomonas bilix" /LENGTH=301 /DNA_ID=CAMNT_0000866985 /DNA_START=81 /DNA_END=986 /DNA_ORIENTATION=- /assembly_acc=CAM_ASM_000599
MATLIDLPDDVLVKVLSGVDSAFELRKCSYVCKRLASVCRDDLLWRNLCEKGEERWEKLREESENKLKEEEKGGEQEGGWRQRNRNQGDPLPPLEYARDEVGAGEVEVEVEGGPSRDEQGGEVRDMQWRAKYRRNCQRYEAYPPTDIAGAWVGDRRYFQQERSGNAIFGQVLHLTAVCWLDIGVSKVYTPGLYKASFRIYLDANASTEEPTIEVSGEGLGEGKRYEVMYDDGLGKVMKAQRTEITVGPFEVVKEGSVHVKIVRTTSWWKRGLFIESFHRYPLLQEELSDEDSHFRATVKRL